jgi:small-conductance mechanosensitive channel
MPLLDIIIFRNPIRQWLLSLALAVVLVVGLRLVHRLLKRRLAAIAGRTRTDLDNALAEVIEATHSWLFVLVGLSAGSLLLNLPEATHLVLRTALIIGLWIQGGLWGNRLIAHLLQRLLQGRQQGDATAATTASALAVVGRAIMWAIVVLLALNNIPGVQIDTLIASLGIGGVAVALAVQSILGELFASFSIVLDKPFEIGDFIIVDDMLGTIEHIGLRSTRVRSLSGELLAISNSDLLSSRIRNYKQMQQRRVVFSIGVTYDTPHDKVKAIPGMLRQAVELGNKTRFDRAHFKSYGDFSLIFEVVYYVLSADYNTYKDIQQDISLRIHDQFAGEGIEFAFPTRTLYMVRARQADGRAFALSAARPSAIIFAGPQTAR